MQHNSFGSLGEFLQAVSRSDSGAGHARDPRLNSRAMGANTGVPSEGGFAVDTVFVKRLFERLYLTSDILGRVLELPLSGKSAYGVKIPFFDGRTRADGSRWGGVRAYWGREAASITASRPKLGLMEMRTEKLTALAYVTDELLKDADLLELVLTNAFTGEMGFALVESIINGDGLDECLGILRSNALITVSKEVSQTAATITGTNIVDMWSRMWAPSRKIAVWLVNGEAEPKLLPLVRPVSGGTAPLYETSKDGGYATMLGSPVIPCEHLPVIGTRGDILYVDLSRYILAAAELQQAVSMHVEFLSDQQVFRWVLRVNGQPLDALPVTPKNGTVPTSPFITLEARG